MSLTSDQQSECLALESIYGPDYLMTSEGLSIHIRPHMLNDEINHVGVSLEVVFGDTYPETIPEILLIVPYKGLKPEKISELSALALQIAEENVGNMCIYEIVEGVKRALLECNVKEVMSLRDHIQEQIEVEDAKQRILDEEEAARLAEIEANKNSDDEDWSDPSNISTIVIPPNTYVTEENFKAWSDAFLKEQAERARIAALHVVQDDKSNRITGKQWFLDNWKITDEDEVAEQGAYEFVIEHGMIRSKDETNEPGATGAEMIIDESLFDDDSDTEDEYEPEEQEETHKEPVQPVAPVKKEVLAEPVSTISTSTMDKKDKKEKKEKDDKKDKKEKKDKDDKKDKNKKMNFKDFGSDAGFSGFGSGDFVSMSDFLGDVEITTGKKEKKEKK